MMGTWSDRIRMERILYSIFTHENLNSTAAIISVAAPKINATVKGGRMLNEQTFDQLHAMKLIGMAEGFREQLEQSSFRDLSFEERFGMLVERQWSWKENKRLSRFLKEAKLKLQACIEDIDYRTPRGLEKPVILSLASCNWLSCRPP